MIKRLLCFIVFLPPLFTLCMPPKYCDGLDYKNTSYPEYYDEYSKEEEIKVFLLIENDPQIENTRSY